MAGYEFKGSVYRNKREMLDAIADAWLGADGRNSSEFIRQILAEYTNVGLAIECVEEWNLERPAGDKNGCRVDELAKAFARYRANLPATA